MKSPGTTLNGDKSPGGRNLNFTEIVQKGNTQIKLVDTIHKGVKKASSVHVFMGGSGKKKSSKNLLKSPSKSIDKDVSTPRSSREQVYASEPQFYEQTEQPVQEPVRRSYNPPPTPQLTSNPYPANPNQPQYPPEVYYEETIGYQGEGPNPEDELKRRSKPQTSKSPSKYIDP